MSTCVGRSFAGRNSRRVEEEEEGGLQGHTSCTFNLSQRPTAERHMNGMTTGSRVEIVLDNGTAAVVVLILRRIYVR